MKDVTAGKAVGLLQILRCDDLVTKNYAPADRARIETRF